MMVLAKLISTCLGIGYIQKGAGTVAALFYCVLWYHLPIDHLDIWMQLLIPVGILVAGIWSATVVEKEWGKDSNRVVIDEVQGMSLSLFLVPAHWQYALAALILFRFFDIVKPLYIRKAEQIPSGWGVMADDLLAGTYTVVILQIVIKTHLFF